MNPNAAELLERLIAEVGALHAEPPDRPRGAAGLPWHVGFNDAIEEVLEILKRAQAPAPAPTGPLTRKFGPREEWSPAPQCKGMVEIRIPGKRYVADRWQCKRKSTHPSGYCKDHRPLRLREGA